MEPHIDSPHGPVLPAMGTSNSNSNPLSLEGEHQISQKPSDESRETIGETDHFDKLEKNWAELRQCHLRWLEEANEAEWLLQHDLDEARAQCNQEFLRAHKARREGFNKVQQMEMQQFQDSHDRRDLEFKQAQEARQQQHSDENNSESLDFAQQDVEAEHHRRERQAEDAHEESQSQHKLDYKMARREREDQYYLSEAKYRASHRDELKKLQDKADRDHEARCETHPTRQRMEDIRAQIELSHAALMLKLFGNPKSDLRTPIPDMSIPPSDQPLTMTADQERSQGQSQQDAISPATRRISSLPEELSNKNGSQKRPSRNSGVVRPDPPSGLSSLILNAELNRDQHSPRSMTKPKPKTAPKPSAFTPNAAPIRNPKGRSADMIQIRAVEKVFKELGPDCIRRDLWQGVTNEMDKNGVHREPTSAAAAWSAHLRQKCQDLGYDWAERVMSKNAPFKRRVTDTGIENNSATPKSKSESESKSPHPKKRLKQTSKNGDTMQVPTGTPKPKQAGQMKSFYGGCISEAFSYDVTELDWSPDGKRFIVGSMAVENPVADNNPRNLALGSISTMTLREMQSTHLTYGVSSYKKPLYRTVTAAKFSANGDHAVTAGYDGYVRIWDVRKDEQSSLLHKIEHENKVIVMTLGKRTNLIATGIEAGRASVQVWHINEDFTSIKSVGMPYKKEKAFSEYPMALAFGAHPENQNWLSAGFAWDDKISSGGRLSVWSIDQGCMTERDFKPNHSQVFEVAWFAGSKGFVAGTSSTTPSPRQQSCIQVYNTDQQVSHLTLACPAADINTVRICPYQEELVTASCTNGKVYVWDMRNGKNILHTLAHGRPLRAQCDDVGVGMTEWFDQNFLFTGSDDGCLNRWDPRLSAQDVFVEKVYDCQAEIMAGTFSPDKSSLLLGDGDACLHLLRRRGKGAELPVKKFDFIMADSGLLETAPTDVLMEGEESIIMSESDTIPDPDGLDNSFPLTTG